MLSWRGNEPEGRLRETAPEGSFGRHSERATQTSPKSGPSSSWLPRRQAERRTATSSTRSTPRLDAPPTRQAEAGRQRPRVRPWVVGSMRTIESSSGRPLVITRVLVVVVRVYQRLISPLFPASCRYTPTCSEYARQALLSHGLLRGTWLAVRRVLRCHPWADGGVDPVPGGANQSVQS